MTFEITTATIIGIAGAGVGVIGLAVATWQMIRARTAGEMYQRLCTERCKRLVSTVRLLVQPVEAACDLKNENIDRLLSVASDATDRQVLRRLSDQVHAIHISKDELVSACRDLNADHQKEFGEPVFSGNEDEWKELVAERHGPSLEGLSAS